MDFNLPEDLKMIQTLARDFVTEKLIPLEKEILGRGSNLEGASCNLSPEKEAELVQIAREVGLWGISVPEKLGGAGLSVLAACLVEEELAKTVVPFNLGDITPILFECNEEQRREYLIPLIEGRKTAFLAFLEPGQCDDPSFIEMKAEKAGNDYILKGKKLVFAKNHWADFAIVFSATDPRKGIRQGVTAFIVDLNTPGICIENPGVRTGWKTQVTIPVKLGFENCRVPATNILGEEGGAFKLGQKWLGNRRIIRSARCLGAASRLLDLSVEHARTWASFGRKIESWPNIQALIAEITIDIESSRWTVYQAASKADEGKEIHLEAAMAKIQASEMLQRVADRAVMIKNGPGSVKDLPLDRLCRDLLLRNVGQRALQVQKSIVANHILKSGRII